MNIAPSTQSRFHGGAWMQVVGGFTRIASLKNLTEE
jgi:hypothetical protein